MAVPPLDLAFPRCARATTAPGRPRAGHVRRRPSRGRRRPGPDPPPPERDLPRPARAAPRAPATGPPHARSSGAAGRLRVRPARDPPRPGSPPSDPCPPPPRPGRARSRSGESGCRGARTRRPLGYPLSSGMTSPSRAKDRGAPHGPCRLPPGPDPTPADPGPHWLRRGLVDVRGHLVGVGRRLIGIGHHLVGARRLARIGNDIPDRGTRAIDQPRTKYRLTSALIRHVRHLPRRRCPCCRSQQGPTETPSAPMLRLGPARHMTCRHAKRHGRTALDRSHAHGDMLNTMPDGGARDRGTIPLAVRWRPRTDSNRRRRP